MHLSDNGYVARILKIGTNIRNSVEMTDDYKNICRFDIPVDNPKAV